MEIPEKPTGVIMSSPEELSERQEREDKKRLHRMLLRKISHAPDFDLDILEEVIEEERGRADEEGEIRDLLESESVGRAGEIAERIAEHIG